VTIVLDSELMMKDLMAAAVNDICSGEWHGTPNAKKK
jgi:hypothetical protein